MSEYVLKISLSVVFWLKKPGSLLESRQIYVEQRGPGNGQIIYGKNREHSQIREDSRRPEVYKPPTEE